MIDLRAPTLGEDRGRVRVTGYAPPRAASARSHPAPAPRAARQVALAAHETAVVALAPPP